MKLSNILKFALSGLLVGGLTACNLSPSLKGLPTYVPTLQAPLVEIEATGTPVDEATAPPVLKQQTTEPAPEQTMGLVLDPEATPFPEIEWGEAPLCQNEPLSLEGWQSLLANQPEEGRPAFLGEHVTALSPGSEDPIRNELAALELNLASGRLNRASQIELAGLPNVKTIGDLEAQLESGLRTRDVNEDIIKASQQIQAGNGITQPVCGRILYTQYANQPSEATWSTQGIQTAHPFSAQAAAVPGEPIPLKDTGVISPDGRQAAFTSLQGEAGGPVFLLDLQTGEWTNVIEAVNEHLAGEQAPLQKELWWEVAGWLPDSQRLLLSPADLSAAFLIDLRDFTYRVYGFDGGGLGGGRTVQLSPDGSRFAFVGMDNGGGQTLGTVSLDKGETSVLGTIPSGNGFILYPRFSPDSQHLAYLVQSGHPTTGLAYSINVYTFVNANERVLVQGNLGQSVPVWSPDGQWIAFTQKEPDEPDIVIPEQVPPPMRGNVWVISVESGTPIQVTFIDGWARNPAWDYDARTLAFVTHDGQVGMVSIDQPGHIWRAAETSSEYPLITSVFFVP